MATSANRVSSASPYCPRAGDTSRLRPSGATPRLEFTNATIGPHGVGQGEGPVLSALKERMCSRCLRDVRSHVSAAAGSDTWRLPMRHEHRPLKRIEFARGGRRRWRQAPDFRWRPRPQVTGAVRHLPRQTTDVSYSGAIPGRHPA